MHLLYSNTQISWVILEQKINEINARIFSLFQTGIEDILRNKFEWMDQKGISTDVINDWYYWEYEQFIKLLNDKNKEETEQRKKQDEEQNAKYSGFNPAKMMGGFNPGKMMGGSNSAFPRI